MTTLLDLFNKCLHSPYNTIKETQGDYWLARRNDKLYLLLECSNQTEDWIHNFDFAAKPYKDMPQSWKAHKGFTHVWKSIVPYIEDDIKDSNISQIIIIGYSHGAALACLAQEYVWFNRPDIRDNCYAFAFEPPRVFCGFSIPKNLKERWKNLYVFRNGHDLVTHLPPVIFNYKHVGNLIKIGKSRKHIVKEGWIGNNVKWLPKCVLEHDYPNIQYSLKEYEENLDDEDTLKNILKNI